MMDIMHSDWAGLVRPLPPSLFLSLPLLCLFNWLVVLCININIVIGTNSKIAIYHRHLPSSSLSSHTHKKTYMGMRYGKYVYVHIQYIDFVRIVPGCQSWCSKWMMKMIKSNIIQVQADPFPLSYIATCAVHYILTQPYFKGVILIVFITMLHTYQNFNVPNYFSRRALGDNGELLQAFSFWLSRVSIRAHNSQVVMIMIRKMVKL